MPREIWKPIPRHRGYKVSSHGRVRSLDRLLYNPPHQRRGKNIAPYYRNYPGKILTPASDGRYLRVKLDHNPDGIQIHRLVARTFIGPQPKGQEVCHNDGIKTNNRLGNLRYGTHGDNGQDLARHGNLKGILNPNAKLTENEVKIIRRSSAKRAVLAMKYGVHYSTIGKAQRGETYRNILP